VETTLTADQRSLFCAMARSVEIPDAEARVDEAQEELADLIQHVQAVMAYPLPMQLEPATQLAPGSIVTSDPAGGDGP